MLMITERLAELLVKTDLDHMPAEAVETAKLCLMDWLAVTLAGHREPLADILFDLVSCQGGNSQATVLGRGNKISALYAALLNGSASHALDYDDVHVKMLGHPTVPVAPAVFALGEWHKASGRAMIEAFILGVETECRISGGVSPNHYMSGWHATGTLGTFGAAAAAGKLLGLTWEQMVYALGLAGTQAAGLRQVFGTMAKPFHAGKAAFNGLTAALLAQKGFTCSRQMLEGDMGFSQTMAAKCTPDTMVEGWGDPFEILEVQFKWHASCFQTHPAIDAALAMEQLSPSDEIREIVLTVYPACTEVANITDPKTGLEGKFCIPYCTAVALLEKQTDESQFTDEMVSRTDLYEIQQRIKVVEDDSLPTHQARIVVTRTDGSVMEAKADTLALGKDPSVRKTKVGQKFLRLAGPVLGDEKAKALQEQMKNFEKVEDLSELSRLFSP